MIASQWSELAVHDTAGTGAVTCTARSCCWRVVMTSNCCTMYCRICSIVGGAGSCCCCCLNMLCDVGASMGNGGEESLSSSSSLYENAWSSLCEKIIARLN